MRNISIIALLSLLAACNSADQSVTPAETPAPAVEIKDFKTIDTALSFSGYWVNAKYAAAVRQSKSPSRTTIPEKSAIKIPARTLQETSMVYNFHEGGDACVFVKNGDHYELWDAALTKKREDVVVSGESIRRSWRR